ncbi:MAG: MoaD/ThiS family protein [Deltaproteobacteria bacterium]|nr:MoaD/ThiS family protein [Deltaproteobacteria bacterium]RLA89197.1 MAG: MoaD/ThiS family protein [Deltaproteobacteria bacterium]
MEITVKLFATLRKYLPEGSDRFSCHLQLDSDVKVLDVIKKLGIPEDMPKIILINGIHAKIDQKLKNGDLVAIFPPVAGG